MNSISWKIRQRLCSTCYKCCSWTHLYKLHPNKPPANFLSAFTNMTMLSAVMYRAYSESKYRFAVKKSSKV